MEVRAAEGDEHQRRRVVIVQSLVRQYRAAFFESLRRALATDGVDLDLVYGSSTHPNARGATVDLPWAELVDERRFRLGALEVTWQPCLRHTRDADLVVVEQANRKLLNYVLLFRQALGGPRVALWGHGRNFQTAALLPRVAARLKNVLTRRAHWFFAYNQLSADVLGAIGYPLERIAVVGNSVDTESLAAARDRVTAGEVEALRQRLGLQGGHIGIFCGTMYTEKRISFLIEAVRLIRSELPDFEFVCIGDGMDRPLVEAAAAEFDWFHFVGRRFGDDLARHFALADVFLLPGLVGLAVLDSFVFGVPLVTTEDAHHSPEIDYLEDGHNGMIVPGDGSGGAFAHAVVALLADDALRERLKQGCLASAASHSAEAMARRFAHGIDAALAAT